MKKIVYMLPVLLFLSILLTTGCNKKTQKEAQKSEETVVYCMEQISLESDDFLEVGSDISQNTNKNTSSELQGKYQKMKFLQNSYYILSEEDGNGKLLILDIDGKLTDTITFEKDESVNGEDFYVSENGEFYVLSVQSKLQLESVYLYYDKYDRKGTWLSHQELGEYSLNTSRIAAENGCLLYNEKKFILYSNEEEIVWEKPAEKIMFDAMIYGQDGYFYIIVYGNNRSRNILKINSKTGKTEEEFKTEFNFAQVPDLSWGENGHEIYFCDQKRGIYRYDLEKQTSEKLLDWVDNGINGDGCSSVYARKDGFLCLSYGNEERTKKGLYQIIPEKTAEKVILTIGTIGTGYELSEMVIKFNQQNKDVQLVIRDYSEYEDYSTQIQLDITTGNCPDILDASIINENLIKKGGLVNLYSFMETDPEMQPEEFVESVLKVLEYNNELYVLPTMFHLSHLVCNKQFLTKEESIKIAALENGISVELLEQLRKRYPKKTVLPETFNTQRNFLHNMINAIKPESLFNSKETEEEFSRLLAFCKELPSEAPPLSDDTPSEQEQAQKGTVLFLQHYISSPLYDTIRYRSYYGKGNYIFCGYPCTEGSGVCMTLANGDAQACFGISSLCKDKEAAWQFVRSFLTEEMQEKETLPALPVRKKALKKMLNQKKNVSGKEISMTKEEKKNYLALVDSVEYFDIFGQSANFRDIISEETEAYFLNEKSLEETVDIIKRRISLYISEQE